MSMIAVGVFRCGRGAKGRRIDDLCGVVDTRREIEGAVDRLRVRVVELVPLLGGVLWLHL